MEINNNSKPNVEMIEGKEEEDRLSNLPESLLLHILSFLPMKYALKMRTLTRRWRDLWPRSLAHALDLDFNIWYSDENFRKYIDFVNQSLSLHQSSNIRKFRCVLICKSTSGFSMNSWIDFAIKKKVQELDLYLSHGCYDGIQYNLPHSFYAYRSLTSLKLEGFELDLHHLKSFTYLRSLSLRFFKLEDGLFHEFLAVCPLLENLRMDSCFGLSGIRIPSSCLRLHHLSIRDCFFDHGFEIHGMSLISLEVHEDIYSSDYIFKISSSAKEVSLHLVFRYPFWKSWSLGGHDNISFRIFKYLAETEVLSLGSSCVQLASTWELRKFHAYFYKLKHLKLEIGFGTWERCGRWQLHGIASLLKKSPQLETLIIDMGRPGNGFGEEIFKSGRSSNEKEYWELQKLSFPCLVHHLKTIKIYSHIASRLKSGESDEYVLKMWENEMMVVKFFMKNAMVLEKMTIQSPMAIIAHDKAECVSLEIRQKLKQLPKASSHAQLLFL